MCGIIGDDSLGKWLISELDRLGIDVSYIIPTNRPTTQKSRILISHQQVLRVDREESTPITPQLEDELFELLCHKLHNFDAIIVSDYAKGLLTPSFTKRIISLARSCNRLVLVDPKGSDYAKYKNATLLTPNKLEASLATQIQITDDTSLKAAMKKLQALDPKGSDYAKYKNATLLTPNKLEASLATQIQITDDTSLKAAMKKLQALCKLDICLVTLSEDGIAILRDDSLVKSPTIAKEVYDVTGAGDTVIAALAFGLSSGLDIYQASDFANAAAAVVIGKIGSASASLSEIISFLHDGVYADSKVISQQELHALLKSLHEKKIIFTNGCFDILHAGHISYLQKARELGDVLIVGLNSDSSVKRLKGESRPIIPQEDRAAVLAGLECVDFVVIFEEDTPLELIKLIKPAVLVKGADRPIIPQEDRAAVLAGLECVDFVVIFEEDTPLELIKLIKPAVLVKGADYPIIPQEDRAAVLAGLECVDFVVIFEEDTPLELIKLIKPAVLVKGADYTGKEVVGSEFAKEVKLIEFVQGRSSTSIIEKIRSL